MVFKPDSQIKGLYWYRGRREKVPATKNLVPGFKSYDERIIKVKGVEYRIWNPYRSKPAAALMKGFKTFPIREGMTILYLGIASGTTASHFSDIIGRRGLIYGVDVSAVEIKDLLKIAAVRGNIAPILADASKPELYSSIVQEVDFVYCDIAQPNQTEIFLKNVELYLKERGFAAIAIKASSIDATAKPSAVFKGEKRKISKLMSIVEETNLDPYAKKHRLILSRLQ
ncbi:MAG: fibrillarin-like rRNA/tRNA 2'-O-methyltransferase [Thermoproteota archaeon]|nr:MAG: fibrillarin-like rRNA/tRNA 2'-O-methyltransferase [Candidatus Korarchaeota archaeon]